MILRLSNKLIKDIGIDQIEKAATATFSTRHSSSNDKFRRTPDGCPLRHRVETMQADATEERFERDGTKRLRSAETWK